VVEAEVEEALTAAVVDLDVVVTVTVAVGGVVVVEVASVAVEEEPHQVDRCLFPSLFAFSLSLYCVKCQVDSLFPSLLFAFLSLPVLSNAR